MYFTLAQTSTYLASLAASALPAPSAVDVFAIPDFLSLAGARAALPARILVGAQNCGPASQPPGGGAYTGEVAARCLAELGGVSLVELGHAERRRFFAEDDAMVAAKAGEAARCGLVPLVCVGEKVNHAAAEGEGVLSSPAATAAAIAEVAAQLVPTLDAVLEALAARARAQDSPPPHLPPDGLIIAYEPVWAIGAAHPAPVAHVAAVAAGIRALLDARGLARARILYGGSAGPGLWARLAATGDAVDGLFLGRFAHDVARFVQTIREVAGEPADAPADAP
jgi:triosephosphate isomerase